MVKITETIAAFGRSLDELKGEIQSLRADLIQHRIEIAIITRFWTSTTEVDKEGTYQELLKEYLEKNKDVQKDIEELKKRKEDGKARTPK